VGIGSNGTKPRAEIFPNELCMTKGKVLKRALNNDSGLNKNMEGMDFSLDGFFVDLGFFMKEAIFFSAFGGFHDSRPEVIGVESEGSNRLFKSDFDFEAFGVKLCDLNRGDGKIGAKDKDTSSLGMIDPDKANKLLGFAPKEVEGFDLNRDLGFPWGSNAIKTVFPLTKEFNFFSVNSLSSSFSRRGQSGGGLKSDCIISNSSDEMIAVFRKLFNQGSRGVIGIGD